MNALPHASILIVHIWPARHHLTSMTGPSSSTISAVTGPAPPDDWTGPALLPSARWPPLCLSSRRLSAHTSALTPRSECGYNQRQKQQRHGSRPARPVRPRGRRERCNLSGGYGCGDTARQSASCVLRGLQRTHAGDALTHSQGKARMGLHCIRSVSDCHETSGTDTELP